MITLDENNPKAIPSLLNVHPACILNKNLRGDIRELLTDFQVVTRLPDGSLFRQTIPARFQADGASVPKIWIVRTIVGGAYDNHLIGGAEGHDWGFYNHMIEQCVNGVWTWVPLDFDTANRILQATLRMAGTSRLHAWEVYKAVSWFGESHWPNDAEDRRYLAVLRQQIIDDGRNPSSYGLP